MNSEPLSLCRPRRNNVLKCEGQAQLPALGQAGQEPGHEGLEALCPNAAGGVPEELRRRRRRPEDARASRARPRGGRAWSALQEADGGLAMDAVTVTPRPKGGSSLPACRPEAGSCHGTVLLAQFGNRDL